MLINYNNERLLDKPLPEVLHQFYTVDALHDICRNHIYPALQNETPPVWPKKILLAASILEVFNNREMMKQLWKTMSPKLKQLLMIIVWDGDQELKTINEKLNFEVAKEEIQLTLRESLSTSYRLLPEFTWVALHVEDNYYYYNELQLFLRLPPAIRTVFRKHFPKPEGYNLIFQETLPAEGMRYSCEDTLIEDLRIVADYINRDHIKFKQNGGVRKNCLKELDKLTKGGEFFPDNQTSQKLPLLRHELLVEHVLKFSSDELEDILRNPEKLPDFIKMLPEILICSPESLLESVLSFIKGSPYLVYSGKYLVLQKLFEHLEAGKWTTFENLKKFIFYRDVKLFPDIEPNTYVSVTPSKEFYYKNRLYIGELSDSELQDIITYPLLKGCLFLLATFGLLEIAYTEPKNEIRTSRSDEFLTPYDGAKAFRLTSLGAFALGLTDELEVKVSSGKRPEITLNPDRLTAICRNVDLLTEKSLLEFMDKVADGCYHMTRKSFLKKCTKTTQIKKHVQDFYSHICANPPELWIRFFEETQKTSRAMKVRTEYVIFELVDTPEIRHLFLSDPILRNKTIKVEGMKVAIKKKEVASIQKRLSTLGYLPE